MLINNIQALTVLVFSTLNKVSRMLNDLTIKAYEGRLTDQEWLAIGLRLQAVLGLKFIAFDPDLKFRLDSGETQNFTVEFGLNLIQKIGG
jgi:hypothetical protein